MSGEPPLTTLPASSRPLLEAARTVLATPGLPPVVLIGGLAVTTCVSAAGVEHRATVDIDLVTTYLEPEPEAAELIADAHHSAQDPLLVDGVKVDIIPTNAVSEADLDGLDDGSRLFVSGHRWAFETSRWSPTDRQRSGGSRRPHRLGCRAGRGQEPRRRLPDRTAASHQACFGPPRSAMTIMFAQTPPPAD